MKYGILSATNGCYDAETWAEYDALYRGGKAFHARIGKFLPSHPMEPANIYEARKQEARYRSYCGTITDFFASQLMSAPMTIRKTDAESGESLANPDPFYAKFESDADGLGCDIVSLCRKSFRKALVKQAIWWLAVLPSNDGTEPVNQDEWEKRDLGRARLVEVEPEAILDWEYADDGDLSWVLMYTAASPRKNFAATRGSVTHTWRLYDRVSVSTFEAVKKSGDANFGADDDVTQVDQTTHGFQVVPFTRLHLPDGLWLMNRVADTQLAHFRLENALHWAIKRTCYAMPIFITADEGPKQMGAGYYIQLAPGSSVEWAAPPAGPFTVIADEKKDLVMEIYRVSQQMAQGIDNNAAAVGRSGASKLADANATEMCLKAYGDIMREHVERTLELVASGRKDEKTSFNVEGLERFNLADAATTVANAEAAQALDIPSETAQIEIANQTVDALLPGLDQVTKDIIREEIVVGIKAKILQAKALKDAIAKAPAVLPGQTKPTPATEPKPPQQEAA